MIGQRNLLKKTTCPFAGSHGEGAAFMLKSLRMISAARPPLYHSTPLRAGRPSLA